MSAHDTIRRLTLTALATLGVAIVGLGVAVAPSMALLGYLNTPSSEFGEPGSGNGQFSLPVGVAVDDSSGDVYVTDYLNSRVEEFSVEGAYISQFNGSETPSGSFSNLGGVAVDNSTGAAKGNVYVIDHGHNVIDVFNSSGKYLSQIVGTPSTFADELNGVAVDGSGNVWVAENGGGVDEFSDAGSFLGQFNTGYKVFSGGLAVDSDGDVYVVYEDNREAVLKFTSTGTYLAGWDRFSGVTAIAVNTSSNNVFLATNRNGLIEQFGPFGEPYGESLLEFGSGTIESSSGIAVNDTTGTLYATQGNADKVAIFKAVLFPDATTEAASEVKATSVKVEGIVNPSGEPVTNCQFEYGQTTAYDQSVPCSPAPGGGLSPVNVSAQITGLEPNTTYHYRVVATNANATRHGADKTLTTEAIAPVIGEASLVSRARTEATLAAVLNPENSETTYEFVFGETSNYGEHTYSVNAGSGLGEEHVEAIGLTGLTPSTTYHYALRATNQAGTVTGPDGTFTTAPASPPAVITGGASNITLTSATVAATIEAQGLETSYALELGSDTSDGTSIYGEAGYAVEPVGVSVELQDLTPGTTYHYRFVAINSEGRVYGADQTFTTPPYASPIVQPLTVPLIATPPIAFPAEEPTTTTVKSKPLTKAQKLAKALQACRKGKQSKRAGCVQQARKRYGSPASKKHDRRR
jgi:hypothetical protein